MNIRKRLALYGILLLVAILTMVGLGHLTSSEPQQDKGAIGQPSQRDYSAIKSEGVLRILSAFDDSFSTKADGLSGQVYDLAKSLGKRTGLRIDVVLENSQGKGLAMLEQGQVDLIASSRVRTSDIDTVRFVWIQDRTAGPIYLVQRKDSTTHITNHLDLSGRTISLPQASDLRLFVNHLKEEIGVDINIELDPLYSTEQLIILVESGKRDYTLCSSSEAERYRAKFPNLDISLPMSYSLREGWLVRRTSPILIDSLSVWL